MSELADFLGETTGEALEESLPVAPEAPAGEPQFVTHVTPSGIEVLYQWAPKRLYRVRDLGLNTDVEVDDPDFEWVEVPSVTTVLGVLDKPSLVWWGMTTGVDGVRELLERGSLIANGGDLWVAGAIPSTVAYSEEIVELLKAEKLTVNHVRDKAADRGTSVHDAFENWAIHGVIPQPAVYPEHERGYVEALLKFIAESDLQPLEAEVSVGSIIHGYAGRYDLRAVLPKDTSLVTAASIEGVRKGEKRETIPAGLGLWDLKTSKGFYETHFLQLEAYEEASVECGYDETDYRAVLRVDASGEYEVEVSKATAEDFLAVLEAKTALDNLKQRRSKRRRKADA